MIVVVPLNPASALYPISTSSAPRLVGSGARPASSFARSPSFRPLRVQNREVPKRLAAIAARREDLGVREEATILTAADLGIQLDRREDADPRIVLQPSLDADE